MGGYARCLWIALATGALVAGCGDSSEHSPLPEISDLGGPRLAHPELVPIFFAGDPQVDDLTRFSRWIVTSDWLGQVGADYGVGGGTMPGAVQRADAAPSTISDGQIVDLVYAGIADRSLPRPGPDTLYMLYFPVGTAITAGSDTSCVDFGGYHAAARRNRVELAYAVIAACDDNVQARELIASHELIEAATDPFPDNHPGFQISDPSNPWLALGAEVADLSQRNDPSEIWNEGEFIVQRSWSNSEAAAGREPCVPHMGSGVPYFSVVAESPGVPRIPPGGHQAIELSGWATGVTQRSVWTIRVQPSTVDEATFALDPSAMSQSATASLDVAMSASTPAGTVVRFSVVSQEAVENAAAYQVLPMLAVAGDPCSRFTSCVSCSAQIGCGFCTTTGTCESAAATGSAESSCPANAFATWPGSCGDFCAMQGDSCASCSSLPGCGWCASGGTPHCLEASHDGGRPEKQSCDYADWSFTPSYCSP